jgi:hypothetical protein
MKGDGEGAECTAAARSSMRATSQREHYKARGCEAGEDRSESFGEMVCSKGSVVPAFLFSAARRLPCSGPCCRMVPYIRRGVSYCKPRTKKKSSFEDVESEPQRHRDTEKKRQSATDGHGRNTDTKFNVLVSLRPPSFTLPFLIRVQGVYLFLFSVPLCLCG